MNNKHEDNLIFEAYQQVSEYATGVGSGQGHYRGQKGRYNPDADIFAAHNMTTNDPSQGVSDHMASLKHYIDVNMPSTVNQGTISAGTDAAKTVQDLKGIVRTILKTDPNQREAIRAELYRAMKSFPERLDEPRIAEILGEPGRQSYRDQKPGQWNKPHGVKWSDL